MTWRSRSTSTSCSPRCRGSYRRRRISMDEPLPTLVETLAGLAAAQMGLIWAPHEQPGPDKTHLAHAFARALDTLAPEHRGGMVEHVLKNLRDRCMNLRPGESDAQEWLRQLLART